MAYCFMHIEKVKTLQSLTRKQTHNLREGFVPNADISRAFLNEELVPVKDGKSFSQTYRDTVKNLDYYKNHKMPKNSVKAMELMMTYSHGKDDLPEKFSIDKWKEENVKWLEKTFGKDNLVSVVLHMDEATPHIHAIVLPVVEGRMNASYYRNYRQLQDSYAEQMSEVGLRRGKENSIAKHEDIQKFYKDLNDVVKKVLPEKEKDETPEHYYKRISEIYQAEQMQHFQEKKDWQRQLEERKTDDLNEQLRLSQKEKEIRKKEKELKLEQEKLKKQKEHFDKMYSSIPEKARDELFMTFKLWDALEEYPDEQFSNAVKDGIDDIMDYYIEKHQDEFEQEQTEFEEAREEFTNNPR